MIYILYYTFIIVFCLATYLILDKRKKLNKITSFIFAIILIKFLYNLILFLPSAVLGNIISFALLIDYLFFMGVCVFVYRRKRDIWSGLGLGFISYVIAAFGEYIVYLLIIKK